MAAKQMCKMSKTSQPSRQPASRTQGIRSSHRYLANAVAQRPHCGGQVLTTPPSNCRAMAKKAEKLVARQRNREAQLEALRARLSAHFSGNVMVALSNVQQEQQRHLAIRPAPHADVNLHELRDNNNQDSIDDGDRISADPTGEALISGARLQVEHDAVIHAVDDTKPLETATSTGALGLLLRGITSAYIVTGAAVGITTGVYDCMVCPVVSALFSR